jgi:hypothetical protein
MSCTGEGATDIGNWATGLWTNIGMPSTLSALTISGYVPQSFTLGQLNAYIGQCYSGVSGAYVCPNLDDGSFAILAQMFLKSYYMQLMQANAGAGGVVRIAHEIREADRSIKWVNQSEIAKTYLSASQAAEKTLNNLVRNYVNNSLGGNVPKSVSFMNLDNSWNGSAAFDGGGVVN